MKPTLTTRLRLALLTGASRLTLRLLQHLAARALRAGRTPGAVPRPAPAANGGRIIDGEFRRVDAPHAQRGFR